METQIKANLTDKSTWIRLIAMLLFAVIFNVAELVVGAVVVVQFFFKLLTGKANEKLQDFGRKLATYFQQIIAFLTYHTEDKPFPFGEWPGAASDGGPPVAAEPAPAAKAPAARKSPAKRKPKPASPAAPKAEGGEPADEGPKE